MLEITDRTFEVHRRGKVHTGLNIPVKSRDDLSMAYTPGVARVCSAIAENRQREVIEGTDLFARGIAGVVDDDELDEDYIIPSVFNRDVGRAVPDAVQEVAERSEATLPEAADQPTLDRAAIG